MDKEELDRLIERASQRHRAREKSSGQAAAEQGEGTGGEVPSPQGATEGTSAQEELERLRADLERANRESEEHFRLLQRAQADLINYRRRVEQERGEVIRAGKAEVILSILPVLDDFERALQAVPPKEAHEPWMEGVALIERKLRNALESQGVTPIEALGQQFNPWEHEAVAYEESPEHEEGQVIEVFRPGYKLEGRVIRPAQVKVAKGS